MFRKYPWWSFVVDFLLVMAFVLIGRSSHDEGETALGIATTAWPFVSGLIIGWLSIVGVRWNFVELKSGAVIWVATVFVGMLLRKSSEQGIAVSFVIVAAIVLGVFLVGWRVLALSLAGRRRRGRA
ncbi:MAG: hypothetical protein JWP75_1698 [Frondihabitans sp.]|nr:hypothetical protein [Frondihabitans sp.]